MNFRSKPIIVVCVIVVVIITAAGIWYWSQKRVKAPEMPAATKVKDGLGAEAFKKINNPLSNEIPETNPFHIDTNPFK